jgi:sortase A
MKWGVRNMLVLGLISVSAWQAGEAAYIYTKAWLAQKLIASAWSQARDRGEAVRPWPWADTWPVARLDAPKQGESVMVLAGASGRTLAFGPGHVEGTPLPNEPGNSVISGHRDTHFSFLRQLHRGDALVVQSGRGEVVRYRVRATEVVHRKDVRVLMDAGDDRLTLVTCFPFDSPTPGGPLRYVVIAVRDPQPAIRT